MRLVLYHSNRSNSENHAHHMHKMCGAEYKFLFCNVQQVLCAVCEVIRAVQMKTQDFWDMKQCRMVNGYLHFERGCAFHLQGLSKRFFLLLEM